MIDRQLSYNNIQRFFSESDQIIIKISHEKMLVMIDETSVSIGDFVRACSYFGQRHHILLKFIVAANFPNLTLNEFNELSKIISKKIIVQSENGQEKTFLPNY